MRSDRGKSGLHRAGCWPTASGGDPREQCHRKQTASLISQGIRGVRVKACGKSARIGMVTFLSANPIWSKVRALVAHRRRTSGRKSGLEGGPPESAGRPLDGVGNGVRRRMVTTKGAATRSWDRTRLMGGCCSRLISAAIAASRRRFAQSVHLPSQTSGASTDSPDTVGTAPLFTSTLKPMRKRNLAVKNISGMSASLEPKNE